MALLRALADFLFPPACGACGRPGDLALCDVCRSRFRLIAPPICVKCGHPLRGPPERQSLCTACRSRAFHFTEARATGIYEGELRSAIHAFKFRGARSLGRPLGQLMGRTAENWGRAVDLIASVPLHSARLRERGFNQSELLAREVGERLGLAVDPCALRRCRATKSQSMLGQGDRGLNVLQAFVAAKQVEGRGVLLIDDVFSTGHTASACAGALLLRGARNVYVLTAAMSVLEIRPGS